MVEVARPGVGTVALVATAAAGAEAGEKEMAAEGVAVELKEGTRAAAVMRAEVAAMEAAEAERARQLREAEREAEARRRHQAQVADQLQRDQAMVP